MKKILNYLRSMRFGILVLALIAALSVVGTLLPQGARYLPWYAERYSAGVYHLIYVSRVYDIYHSWYYQLLMVLLCLNLSLCSYTRLRAVAKGRKGERERAAALPNTVSLSAGELQSLRQRLSFLRCREERFGQTSVFYKNGFGRYGSFLTHLSILLTVIVGAAALYLPTETERSALIGETVALEDGTRIAVDDFSVMSGDGRLDYTSRLRVTLPDGRESGPREVKVNHPLTFGRYKLYQSGYGIRGSVQVWDAYNQELQLFALDDMSFISADGVNGVQYIGVVEVSHQGEGAPSGGTTYTAYQVYVVEDGTPSLRYVGAGESLVVGDLRFTFQYPYYPVLTVKHMSPLVNGLLIGVFALMVIALTVTFFLPPVVVKVDGEGYAVAGPKPENMKMELAAYLAKERGEET